MVNFTAFVLFIRILTCFILYRTFGNIIYHIVQKYSELSISKLCKLEELSIKPKKADLDITFLSNCKIFNVIPKFLEFNLPNKNDSDPRFIRKRLRWSALKKRKDEQYKLEKELRKISIEVYGLLSSLDCYIIRALIKKNVHCIVKTTVRTNEKKLKELTHNVVLHFTPAETVLNLSGTRLSDDELKILKYGMKHSIEPLHINKTDVLTTFDFIHRSTSKDLKQENHAEEVKAKMTYLANNYVNTYKPSKNTLRKYKIIKILRNNKDILLTK